MKTKDQIYANFYQKARKNRKNFQLIKEYLFLITFSLLFLFLFVKFLSIHDIFAFMIVIVIYLSFLFLVAQKEKNIIKVSERKIIKKMRELVDIELKRAEKDIFSCKEKIEKLRQVKKEISC